MIKKKVLRIIFIGSLSMTSLIGCKENNIQVDPEENNKESTKKEKEIIEELTVSQLLENKDKYDGKKVKVRGLLPDGDIYKSSTEIVKGLLDEKDSMQYIELRGSLPTYSYCVVWVKGTVKIEEDEVIIETEDFELIEQLEIPEYDPSDNMGATVYGPPGY